jgi:parvulin-like peptidyl-prolyl isomerase
LSNLVKGLILVGVILCIGVGLVVWKKKVGGSTSDSFNVITREEIESLLADVAANNPMLLKRLAEDPDLKKQQIDNLKQLMAFASEAKKEGLADDPTNKQELENIRKELIAVNYDKELNKDKGQMPPFGFISEDQINAFWAEQGAGPAPQQGFLEKIGLSHSEPVETRSHEDEFNDFLNAKLVVVKANNPEMRDRDITDEERQQAREIFAKTRIYYREYQQKLAAGELSRDLINKANLQVKLQQAQFLARLYSDKAADQDEVTDADIDKYIAEHPDLDPAPKRAQAQAILDRAKAGEDFAALANEFSTDPGNKDTDGTPKGGLYKNVAKGQMVPAFEQAALALKPGEVSPELVETDFGFHIIKLERALGPSPDKDAKTQGDTYDVRHILISTGIKDPEVPNSRDVPVKDYVRNKLEKEKSKKKVDELVAANNVYVADDFTIPAVSDDQLKQKKPQMPQMPQPQQGPPQGGPPELKPDKDAKKPETKKK